VYLEAFEADPARHDLPAQTVLAPLATVARELAHIEAHTGRSEPSVVT
jgi:phosphoglucomutase